MVRFWCCGYDEEHEKEVHDEGGTDNGNFTDVLTWFRTTDFALRLPGYGLIPGITIPIISFWDGQPLR